MDIKLDRDRAREDGASAVEYALLLSMVAAVIFAIVAIFGGQVGQLFNVTW